MCKQRRERFMPEENSLFGLNAVVVLSIAGGLAVAFISLIYYDSFRRSRKRRRFVPGSSGGFWKNLRSLRESLKEEMRLRRSRARERDWEQ